MEEPASRDARLEEAEAGRLEAGVWFRRGLQRCQLAGWAADLAPRGPGDRGLDRSPSHSPARRPGENLFHQTPGSFRIAVSRSPFQ